MVECECETIEPNIFAIFVLIDTWWNVNMQTIESMFINDCVLIDTWWNVNMLKEQLQANPDGFNRYMVECEYRNNMERIYADVSFNRYMVECEYIFHS